MPSTDIDFDYEVIRSSRKTIGLEVKPGKVLVRAPIGLPDAQVRLFVAEHADWVRKHLKIANEKKTEKDTVRKLTEEEFRAVVRQALEIFPRRAAYYAQRVGVTYGRITVRNQKTKWGSCSAQGNLNFNCLLVLAPPEVLDSVVVHELCHRKEMNHSPRFYAEVRRVFPEYDKWNRWLKDNGAKLMSRMP